MADFPISTTELEQIANSAVEAAVGTAEKYEHTSVSGWNTQIINTILQALIDKTSTGETKIPAWKYIVNSTIIQHVGSPSESATAGRRGMHSAVGAYWNNEKDGTWSYKWDGAEKKGLDSVITVTWIAL
ncbi:Tctex-1 [Dendryphion nanum]|uniref:Tctex-1 n=1 Tax=Dendryphion nanum TaxID=256645 RepID=A0A9P9DUS6_9PLEO|nr:Tctex-1 [Dendryphion nanum]